MNIKDDPVSAGERYALRLSDLAKKDPQIGALIPKEAVRDAACKPGLSYDKVIAAFLDGYAQRPALGQRIYEVATHRVTGKRARNYLPAYDTITYKELHDRVKAVSMAWRAHPHCQVKRDEFVCIVGFAGVDFAVIDMACAYAKAVTVPLANSLTGAGLSGILSSVEPVLLASTIQGLALCVESAIRQGSVKSLLVFNYDERIDEEREILEKAKERLKKAGVDTGLILFDDLVEFGKRLPFSFMPAEEAENDKLAMIIHSSGSAGKPKAACISARAMINTWQAQPGALPRVTVIMAPFNHNLGRNEMYTTLNVGGTAYFTLKPDMSTLFEDIRLARPTELVFFPRILELIYQYFKIEVARRLKPGELGRAEAEAAVKAEMRSAFLGDRLLSAAVASAPTSQKVRQFIEDCFDIHLIDGYSNTETGSGGLALDGKINRKVVIDYKLIDVPEMGYLTTDKPYPRGELCVKTKFGIKQYYKQPEATAELFDKDGYSLTGDIVEERGPDQIAIIDRKKDVLKLSQGEYVAVGQLGKIFEAGSELIHQIYVYGNSRRAYLLAVVVPEMEIAQKMSDGEVTESKLKKLISDELHRVGRKEALKSFEIPRDIIIEKERFTRANGLLSDISKYLRPAMERKYGPALEAMYEEQERIQEVEIEGLEDPDLSLSTKDKLVRLLENNLRIKEIETEEPRTFYDLGGDSLGAVLFSVAIEKIFGVTIGADVILSPKGSIRLWVQMIDDARGRQRTGPTSASVHGKGAKILHAKDLQLERFIDKTTLNSVTSLPEGPQPPKTVLLTGANGFLGHILCLKWMEELAKVGGKLICIVRASDDAAAEKRLDRRFAGIDPEMEAHYKKLSERCLEVLAGDISERLLGLREDTFNRLAKEADRICHAAALVNHRLAYKHLFGPNVTGTAEVIRLGITKKKKPVDFISTVGVQSLLDKTNGDSEASPLKPSVKLTDDYAAGYIASKWAGEHLLGKACRELGMTVNIFRCNMIMPDRRYKGQINLDDMLTRLLYSIITTGLAPRSFYRLNADGSRARSSYDGIPVDILSDAIIGLGKDGHDGCRTYNAHNYLHDDVSLDSFVDWIETAGYPIDRIDDYREWYEMMEARLKSLPAGQRQHSMINIMPAYSRPYPADHPMPDCSNFKALVRKVNAGGQMPHLSEAYIHEYVCSMSMHSKKSD